MRALAYYRVQRWLVLTAKYICLVLLVVFSAFPLCWMIITSFKTPTEVYAYPPILFPTHFSLENYVKLFRFTHLERNFLNSGIVALGTSALTLLIGVPCAYSLTRFRFRGMGLFSKLILFVYMLPGVLAVIPIFIMAYRLGLADKLVGLMPIYLSSTLPFAIWLLRSYFAGIPLDLEDAALVDGATRFQALYKVLFPLALPGIVSTAIFTFNVAWNEYLFALVLLRSADKFTLPLELSVMIGVQTMVYGWEIMLAAATVVTVPSMLFMLLTQKALIQGMSEGAVKG